MPGCNCGVPYLGFRVEGFSGGRARGCFAGLEGCFQTIKR